MTTFYAQDYDITLGGTNLSAWLVSATLTRTRADLDDSAMGDSSRARKGGLKDGTLALEFHQDFAASAVNAVIETIFDSASGIGAFTIKPTTGGKSATNPSYEGNILVTEYSPIDGRHGDNAMMSVSWPLSGDVTVDITP